MKLILKNIGMLEHAELTLHPLSIIAGENDNGKSTAGKIFFCIVKAINRYEEDLLETKGEWANEKIHDIFELLRESLHLVDEQQYKAVSQLRFLIRRNYSPVKKFDLTKQVIDEIADIIDITPKTTSDLNTLMEQLQTIVEEPKDKNTAIKNAFSKVFASEFDSSILLQGKDIGEIELLDDGHQLLHLIINSDNNIELVDEAASVLLTDATFIESPIILNYHDLLIRSQTLLDVDQRSRPILGYGYTTLHTKDLFDKLTSPDLPPSLFNLNNAQIADEIDKLISGSVGYDRAERNFIYAKSSEAISIKNTASGIKTFGLLSILLRGEFLEKNTLLIFDEPENHLHPKWQLHLAEVLVKLAQEGVFVLVSSHSPYMIEALKRYAERSEMDDKARFFLAKDRKIEDRDRLPEIFSLLAEPFEKFRQMDAEDLRDE